eukprot:gene934-4188_t
MSTKTAIVSSAIIAVTIRALQRCFSRGLSLGSQVVKLTSYQVRGNNVIPATVIFSRNLHFANPFKDYVYPLQHSNKLLITTLLQMRMKTTSPLHSNYHIVCWKCNASSNDPILCTSCGAPQPIPKHIDFFALFKEQASFDIAIKNIENKFRSLQNKLHPDRFALKSERERDYSGKLSAHINFAFKTIQSPLQRALYLLQLNGHPVVEQERAADTEFLMEVMELNEQLAEVGEDEYNLLNFEQAIKGNKSIQTSPYNLLNPFRIATRKSILKNSVENRLSISN